MLNVNLVRLSLFLCFCLCFISKVSAKVKLPAFISSNMVLQQQTKVRIWGWADAGKLVSIRFSWSKQSLKAQVNPDGQWELMVSTPAAGGPYRMVVKEGNEVVVDNILIGEVWFCSGQSNMTMPVKGFPGNPVKGSTQEILEAKNDKIRLFDVGRATFIEGQTDVAGSWKEVSSESVANFSATAWFFGKAVQQKLGIPVGLITSSWGGSTIETWMSEQALSSYKNIRFPKPGDSIKTPQQTPGLLFKNMISPLIGYGIKGVIWYQGESNRGNPDRYPSLMENMVQDWRHRWGLGNFPFYYLQIAPFRYFPEGKPGISSAYIREAQLKSEKIIPNSGMATLMDAGEEQMIHPSDKKSAGSRLAYLALSRTYGFKGFSDTGPVYQTMEIKKGTARITFDHAELGLTSYNKKLSLFEIAGEDRKFVAADAVITASGVEVSSPAVEKPVAVRYAFKDFVIGDLFNNGGLPASSFRTDQWPMPDQAYTYARPDRHTLISALQTCNTGNAHPRLYARAADFEALRLKIKTNPLLFKWYAEILAKADRATTGSDSIPYAYDPDPNKSPITRLIPDRLYALAMAYQISGRQQYADRAYKEMEAIAAWPQWGTIRNFLKIADVMQGFSVGYDWCYTAMSPAQRSVVKKAIISKGLDSLIKAYHDNPNYTYTNGLGSIYANNNWNPWCNGAGFACALAIGDEEPALAGEIMEKALRVVENFASTFGPDGASVEGPGYGNGSMSNYIKWIAAMESALSTSYNYFEVPGIPQYAYFPVYTNGPVSSLNFHDSGTDVKRYLDVAFFVANKLKEPMLGAIREQALLGNSTTANPFDLLWYTPPYQVSASQQLPLDKYFKGDVQTGSFRSSFTDPNASFLAFHVGENNVAHTHLDIGHFNIDAMGLNWALDLGTEPLTYGRTGKDTYTSRYELYRINAGGHNTLLIDPSSFPGQSITAFNPVTRFVSKPDYGFAIVDMTKAYSTQADKAMRGFALRKNRTSFLIQDELSLKKNSDVWWFMHTKASVKVSPDGKSAILSQAGKQMYARLASPANGQFLALKAEPLPAAMQNANQMDNRGIQKLTVKVPQVKQTTITVELTPISKDNDPRKQSAAIIPLSQWEEAERSKPQATAVHAGDVVRTSYADTATVNLYQGNGRFGSSYGPLGLHNNPNVLKNSERYGKTEYMHIGHWIRARFNAEYLLPLVKVYWKDHSGPITDYRQHQSYYDGLINTRFSTPKGQVGVETWFDAVERDISGIIIDVEGQASDIVVDPLEKLLVHYAQQVTQQVQIIPHTGYLEMRFRCQGKQSSLFLVSNTTVELEGNKLRLKLHKGKNSLLFSYNRPISVSVTASRDRTTKWWNRKWQTSTSLVLPDHEAQKIWVRSMAIILSTVNDDHLGFPPPMGFSGNGWPFPFPQDLAYIHSLLLTTGQLNVAKSWIEQYAAGIEGMRAYTRRLFNKEGIFLPWVFPYGSFEGYHTPQPPNIFNFEIHNSGYLCRMASETARYVDDPEWTRKYAAELIRGTALFYKSIAAKGADGYWHLSIKPSMGQDEMGGVDQSDYLCALYSAQYCFQQAIAFKLDEEGVYASMLKDGLAFPKLLSDRGVYFTNAAGKNTDLGKQKHPVQLNELAFLPVDSRPSAPAEKAYLQRYQLTQDAKNPHFYGWTLGEFLLAGSRMGLVEEWKKDWDNIRKSDYTDPEQIQLYETSKATSASFYTTTHALVAESILRNLVDDWFGKLEIAKCNPWVGKVVLQRVYSLLGVYCSGEIEQKKARLELTAWKDCSFELQGKQITLKKGERRTVVVN